MKFFSDFMKVVIWMFSLMLLTFFTEYWIATQRYSDYSIVSGGIFFISSIYISYKLVKI